MARELGASQRIGGLWANAAGSLALVVPSVLVPQEHNYVLNVRHPLFRGLRLGKPEAFSFDERLWGA